MPSDPVRVLVTRPQHQCAKLITKLSDYGFDTIHFPAIALEDTHHSERNLALMQQLHRFQLAIFISQNAVTYGLRLLDAATALPRLPTTAAIGRSTRALLEHHGIVVSICPPVPNSETLLNMPPLQHLPAGSRVLIFRGHGGKETLACGLRARQIEVQYAEVYRRLKPSGVQLSLTQTPIDIIMVTSADSLQNLFTLTMADNIQLLQNTPVIIGSNAMVDLYSKLGFQQSPTVADSPLDDDMINAALTWRQTNRP